MENKLYSLRGGYPRKLSEKILAYGLDTEQLQSMGYVEAPGKPIAGENQTVLWRNSQWTVMDMPENIPDDTPQ